MDLFIASDHAGFALKTALVKKLRRLYPELQDLGPDKLNPIDDYPDYAAAVAQAVAKRPFTRQGILLCGSGQGMCIAANKVKNIRAIVAWQPDVVRSAKHDDMANILCLPASFLNLTEAWAIVTAWFETEWADEARHLRRVKQISDLER